MNETDDPIAHYRFGHELLRDGRFADAIAHFEHAISLDPDNLDAEVYIFDAWSLATCPDAGSRNGRRAIEYATFACKLTEWEPQSLCALAAAYAANGEFSKAADAQRTALELYQEYTSLEPTYLEKCRDRLAQFEASQALKYDPKP